MTTCIIGWPREGVRVIEILNPNGMHNIAVGLDYPVEVHVRGNAGYFVAGMNKQARVTVHGNVGWSVAENIMSGSVRVKGNASECAAASGHGGLVVIEGDSFLALRNIDERLRHRGRRHRSATCPAFMAQAGNLVVCGDAGAHLGDSLYEAVIYVRGKIHSLGADAREEPMTEADHAKVAAVARAG